MITRLNTADKSLIEHFVDTRHVYDSDDDVIAYLRGIIDTTEMTAKCQSQFRKVALARHRANLAFVNHFRL